MMAQFAVGGAILPFISLYLRDQGLDFAQISRVLFASSSTLLVFPFLWGMLADRFIPINRLFTLLNVLAFGAIFLILFQGSFLGLLISFTIFYACYHPTLILINALSFHHLPQPQEQFGRLRAWGSFGWMVPSLPIYLWLASREETDLNFVLYLGMSACLLMAVVTLFLPHTEPGARTHLHQLPTKLTYWPAVKRLFQNGNYVILLLSFFLIAASFSLLVYFSPLYLEQCGIDRAWIGPIQCIGVTLEVALFPYLRKFLRQWGFARPLFIGALALLVRQLIFAYFTNPWLLLFSYLLAGMLIVFFHITASILVNHIASLEVRATAQTLFVFFGSGLGPMFAMWVAGRITARAHEDLRPVFLLGAALAGVVGALILVRGRKLDPTSPGKL